MMSIKVRLDNDLYQRILLLLAASLPLFYLLPYSLYFLLVLLLLRWHNLEVKVHLLLTWLTHLLDHLLVTHTSNTSQMIALCIEYYHFRFFFVYVFVLDSPKGVMIDWVLLLIEELLSLCLRNFTCKL